MGLKSGSRDAGLDDSDEADERRADQVLPDTDDTGGTETGGERSDYARTETETETPASTGTGSDSGDATERPAMSSIPYKLRREKVIRRPLTRR